MKSTEGDYSSWVSNQKRFITTLAETIETGTLHSLMLPDECGHLLTIRNKHVAIKR